MLRYGNYHTDPSSSRVPQQLKQDLEWPALFYLVFEAIRVQHKHQDKHNYRNQGYKPFEHYQIIPIGNQYYLVQNKV